MLKSSYSYEPCSDSYRVENTHAQYTTRRRGSRTESYTLLLNMLGLLKAKNHAQKGKGYFQRLRTATNIMHKNQRSLLTTYVTYRRGAIFTCMSGRSLQLECSCPRSDGKCDTLQPLQNLLKISVFRTRKPPNM